MKCKSNFHTFIYFYFTTDGTLLHASICPLPFSAFDPNHLSVRQDEVENPTQWVELLLRCAQELSANSVETRNTEQLVMKDGADILPQFSLLPLSENSRRDLTKLRGFFETTSEKNVVKCVMVASSTICERLPLGHSWGIDSGSAEDTLYSYSSSDGGYGLVRTTLREKCLSHMKLIWVLLSSNAWTTFASVRQGVAKHHSYLKGCLGMCLSLAESEAKRSNERGRTESIGWFLSSGHAKMLEIVLSGMVDAVEQMAEKEEFAALGLRTVDSFFSKTLELPSGLESISRSLSTNFDKIHREGQLIPCLYSILSVMLTILQTGSSIVLAPSPDGEATFSAEYLSSDVPTGVLYNDKVSLFRNHFLSTFDSCDLIIRSYHLLV